MLPRPPPRATFTAFYGDYLPRLWRALVGPPDFACDPLVIGLRLRAPDGEQSLVLRLSGSKILTANLDTPVVAWFTFDEEAFRIGTADLMPRLLRRLDQLTVNLPQRLRAALASDALKPVLERLRALPGTVAVTYQDDAGDLSHTELEIGAGGPRATLEIGDAEVSALLGGGLRVAQLARSRARLGGDTGYLLRVLACLDPG